MGAKDSLGTFRRRDGGVDTPIHATPQATAQVSYNGKEMVRSGVDVGRAQLWGFD